MDSIIVLKLMGQTEKALYLTNLHFPMTTWPCLPLSKKGTLGLLMKAEVGHLVHVSLHAQSRWVTAVIGIRDSCTPWQLSVSWETAPLPFLPLTVECLQKTNPPLQLPVRNTSTYSKVSVHYFKDSSEVSLLIWSYDISISILYQMSHNIRLHRPLDWLDYATYFFSKNIQMKSIKISIKWWYSSSF